MTQTAFDYNTAASDFYRALDANDPEVFRRWLTDDAVFAFNDVPPVHGRDGISEFITNWKSNFVSVTHEIRRTTVDPSSNTVGVEVVVTYVTGSGRIDLSGCSFLEFSGDRIRSYRVYVDTAPLS